MTVMKRLKTPNYDHSLINHEIYNMALVQKIKCRWLLLVLVGLYIVEMTHS